MASARSTPQKASSHQPGFVRQVLGADNRFVTGIALLAALGGFLFGYDTGIVSGALPYASQALTLSAVGESWVVGSLLIGAVIGAGASGRLADQISRKMTLLVAGIVFTVGALGSYFAPDLVWLLVARFVVGLGVGTASFVAPMYISEHSPTDLRGGMAAFNQLMTQFGILIAYLIAYAFKGFTDNWRWMLGFGVVPGVALVAAMFFAPRTPRWLVQRDRVDEARTVLKRTRPDADAGSEIENIQHVLHTEGAFSSREFLRNPLRALLVVGIVMAVAQQVIGVNTVLYFGTTILGRAGLPIAGALAQAVFIGLTNFVFAGVAVLLLDRVGRRKPMIIGTIGSIIGLVVLGWFFHQSVAFQQAHASIALGAMLFYLAFFEISLGPIFWVMISEIYPLRSRAKAMAVATMFNWGANFLVSYFFLQMTQSIGTDVTFWIYAGLGALACVFFVFRLPETSHRTLEEIESQVGSNGGDAARSPDRGAAA